MATSKNPTTYAFSSTGKTTIKNLQVNGSTNGNLESFVCLWLDQDVNSTEDNIGTQQELRQVINHLQTFAWRDQCEEYIQQTTHEKVVLIVSGSLGRDIVPRIHSLPQFSACYVFCHDKKANQQWASKYNKIKGVFTQRSELITAVARDQDIRAKIEEGASISVISHGSKSLQAHNAIFMWFQLFIEVLLRMHHKSTDRKELIDICKKNYKGNPQEMIIINEFEKDYKSDNAIWWYTREACFYRMMNKALRVQDYDMLFALRFFITDIAKQLKNEHEKFIRTNDTRSVIRVYRGQSIGIDELELMKNSIGEYLSMNSFLSTSHHRSTALAFIRLVANNSGHQPILFEIEIDPRMKTKAFADIRSMSYFENEGEVLIMLGALFRIDKVIEDKENRMWIARVSLASEDDYQLKETFAYMKEKIGDDTNLDSLGKILLEMGEYRQAKKCYERLLKDTQLSFGDAQSGLGWAHLRCEEYEESMGRFEQALKARKQLFGDRHAMVGQIYSHIGGLQWFQSDHEQAVINLQKAIEILENAFPPDRLALARSYHNIATNYYNMDEFDSALKYYKKALDIREAVLPSSHPDIAATYNNLGSLYEGREDKKALAYYEKSFAISKKTLPPTHPDIIRTEKNIRRVKEKEVKK